MQAPEIPVHEEQRLKDLYTYDILDTETESDFEDLVDLVSQICRVPIASITFVDQHRQWYKARRNIPDMEWPRSQSFCGHAILQRDVFVVNDATADLRFHDNPLVTGGLKVGFYAGAPIVSSGGFVLGSVCAIDNNPRELNPEQLTALKSISRQISRLLDLRLKNKQIAETARRLIETEKKMAQWNIGRQEEENFRTAYILHEETAQVIAAVKLYIDMAKSSGTMAEHFLALGSAELDKLLKSTTRLSKSIAPTTFKNSNYAGHIEALVTNYAEDREVKLRYEVQPGLDCLREELGIAIFRVTEDLLLLSSSAGSRNLLLQLSATKDEFRLLFEFDGDLSRHGAVESGIKTNIANRAAMFKGEFEIVNLGNGRMSVMLNTPFSKQLLEADIY